MSRTCECGQEIEFRPIVFDHCLPYNVSDQNRHFCFVTSRYCKKVKGRSEYKCEICNNSIPKGTFHYSRPKWKERYHIECLK